MDTSEKGYQLRKPPGDSSESSSMGASAVFAPYQPPQNLHQQQQIQSFWANQMQEIEQTIDFKNHSLPLTRIKKIMKADEDVRMISSEAPIVFSKACEMFILELTLRSWIHTEENKRRTLQKNDIAAAISRTDVFDFLVDIIPRDEMRDEGIGIAKAGAGIPYSLFGAPAEGIPYYYVNQETPAAAAVYSVQQAQPTLPAFLPWSPRPTKQSSDSDV